MITINGRAKSGSGTIVRYPITLINLIEKKVKPIVGICISSMIESEAKGAKMSKIKERYLVDDSGNRISVVLDMDDYLRLLQAFEELDSIHAYDASKASGDEVIPFEQAVAEIERQ